MIKLTNIKKYYQQEQVLDIPFLSFPSQGLFFICGDSGCGKTTLLNIIANFDRDFQGKYQVASHKINYVNQKNILFKNETVWENIKLCKTTQKEYELKKILNDFDLAPHTFHNLASTLSGGEQTRLCLAMNLMLDPDILLADEVTAGLDNENSKMIMDTLKKEAKKRLIICVSHDIELAKKYGEEVLYMQDGKVINAKVKRTKMAKKSCTKPRIFSWEKLFGLVKHKLRLKKVRTSLCLSTLVVGNVCFCFSLLIAHSIKNNFHETFSSFWNKDEIIMSNKEAKERSLVDAAFLDYQDILSTFPDYFSNLSIYYTNNFDSVFDLNEVRAINDKHSLLLKDLSLFSLNDYILDDLSLENEEIVLGCNEVTLKNLSLLMGLKFPTYDNVNNNLHNAPLRLEIHVKKEEWEYEDCVSFTIKKVLYNEKSVIMHSNPLFNQYILEDLMRFKDYDQSIKDLPWLLHKQYYLHCYDGKQFMQDVEKIDYFKCLVPDYFKNDKNKIRFKLTNPAVINVKDIEKELNEDFKNIRIGMNSCYQILQDAMISGWTKDLIMSKEKILIEENIENNFSHNIGESAHYMKQLAYGNIMNLQENSFNFSSELINISGQMPTKENEIVISTALADFLQITKPNTKIYVALLHHSEIKENRQYNYYTQCELEVSGFIENKQKLIYQNYIWPKVFLRDLLDVSNFDLIIENVEFKCLNGNVEEIITNLKKKSNFDFENATGDLTYTINLVLDIVEKVLLAFSFFTIIMAIIMLMLVIYLFTQENTNDFIAMYALGGDDHEVRNLKRLYILVLIFRSFYLTCFTLLTISLSFNYMNNPLIHISWKDTLISLSWLGGLLSLILILLNCFLKIIPKKEKNLANFIKNYK